jgi:nitrile hydratase
MSERFRVGDAVRVHAWFPPGHVRTPWFLRGHAGEIHERLGPFPNAESLAYGRTSERPVPLYRVRFRADALWGDAAERADDWVVADISEHWLEPLAGEG